MKFSCSRDELQNALNIVSKGISERSPNAVYRSILFSAMNQSLQLSSTNEEISIKTSIPADITEDGEILLNASLITEVIRKISGNDVFISTEENFLVVIQSNQSKFTLHGMSASQFPEFPQIQPEFSFNISSKLLWKLIHFTKDAVALTDSIPIIRGIKMEISGSQVRMVSIDGYRLALCQGDLDETVEKNHEVVIPANSLKELLKLLAGQDSTVHVAFSKSQVFFTMGDTVFASRLLEGEFIAYDSLIPRNATSEIEVNKADLAAGCERAELLARQCKNNLISMDFDCDQLMISSNVEIGDVHETIEIKNTGEPIKISFNAKYIIDALKVMDEDFVKLKMTAAFSPALIEPVNSKDYFYMVLPVRG